MYLYLDRKQVICKCCLFILGQLFSIAWSLCIGVCLVPGDVNGPFLSPWEPLFNVSLSAYQNCTKSGRESEGESVIVRKAGWAEGAGAREREEKSNNAISTGSLNDATLATIWHSDKRGPDIVSSKTGLFFDYIPYCRHEDKKPPQSFLVNFQSQFVTVLFFSLCSIAQKAMSRSVPLASRS